MGNKGSILNKEVTIENRTVKVVEELAEGAFSYVFLVKDVSTGVEYAVKRMLAQDKEMLELARNEIRVWKSLPSHDNLVPILASSEDLQPVGKKGNSKAVEFLVMMELAERGRLVDILNKNKEPCFSETEILTIFMDVCKGLKVMHSQNPPIAHRDIKAENVLIDGNGVCKLCDFGSCTTRAKVYETKAEIMEEEMVIQKTTTQDYRPPEMVDLFLRRPITEKVDIWALGVFLYKMAFNTLPFENEGPLAILNVKYTVPSSPQYSSGFIALIKFMLNPDPVARPDIDAVMECVKSLRESLTQEGGENKEQLEELQAEFAGEAQFEAFPAEEIYVHAEADKTDKEEKTMGGADDGDKKKRGGRGGAGKSKLSTEEEWKALDAQGVWDMHPAAMALKETKDVPGTARVPSVRLNHGPESQSAETREAASKAAAAAPSGSAEGSGGTFVQMPAGAGSDEASMPDPSSQEVKKANAKFFSLLDWTSNDTKK